MALWALPRGEAPAPAGAAAAPAGGLARAEGAILGAGGLALCLGYALTFSATSDALMATVLGLAYVDHAAYGRWDQMLQPHHLLYHVTGYALSRAFAPWSDPVAASGLALRLLSAGGAAASVGLLYLLVRRLTGSPFSAAVTALCLACASGFWAYAAVPETHAPAFAATLGVLLALARAVEAPAPRAYAWAGAAHALAVLLRQDTVLLAPLVLLLALVWRPPGGGWRRGAAYALALGLPVGATYAGVYVLAVRGRGVFPSFGDWVAMYGTWGIWGKLGYLTWDNLVLVLGGALGNVTLDPGRWLLLPGALALLVGAGRAAGRLAPPAGPLAALCAAWLVMRLVFVTWWSPKDAFKYNVETSVPFFVLMGLAAAGLETVRAAPWRGALRAGLASLVPVLFWTSLTVMVLPLRGSAHAVEAERWRRVAAPGDLILTNDHTLLTAFWHVARLEAVHLAIHMDPGWGRQAEAQVRAMVRARVAGGGHVFLTRDVLEGEGRILDLSLWHAANGFAVRYPVRPEVVRAVREGLHWRPLDLGEGPRGRVTGYELVRDGADAAGPAPAAAWRAAAGRAGGPR